MTVQKTVADGARRKSERLPNELLGQFYRKIDDLVRRMDQGTLDFWKVMRQLQAILEGLIWKIIQVGGRKTADLIADIESAGMKVSDYATDVMKQIAFITSVEIKGLKTVRIKLCDWFNHNPTTTEIFAEAKKRGLRVAPAELALHLRQEYKDQPANEWLVIGHEPIIDSAGLPRLLCLRRYGGSLWLDTYYAYPDDYWSLGREFVFLAPDSI